MSTEDNETPADPCPIASSIEVFGGKWKSSILFFLYRDGTLRFSELNRRIPMVSKRMLTLQLREMERDGLVERVRFPEVPPRVEYSATPLAKSLIPVFKVIESWGVENMNSVQASRSQFESEASD